MQDLEYQIRFVNCFMNHYNHQYELHVFTNREQLLQAQFKEYAVIITGECNTEEMTEFVEKGEILVCLTEDFKANPSHSEERIVYVEKYQEVYRIAELLERILADKVSGYGDEFGRKEYRCIGIYSLSQERYQVPFAALLAKTLGEQQKVLVLDLQPYSGLCMMEEGMTSMGLEDLLSVVSTGNHSKSRLVECIQHEAEWDYVCAAQNNECLAEGTKELYDMLVALLVKELGYQTIIISLGSVFLGQMELLEACQTVYMLCESENTENWREAVFSRTLLRQEKRELMQKIRKIQIPTASNRETTWRALVDKWSWGSIGELLRQGMKKEITYGAVM